MKKVRGINMFIQEQYLELARKIHRENPVVDAHFDLAAEVYERRLTRRGAAWWNSGICHIFRRQG